MTNQSVYIATQTTTVVCPKSSVLAAIILGETASGSITVYDGTTIIAVLKASIAEGNFDFHDRVVDGPLSVVTAGASKLTVVYRPS